MNQMRQPYCVRLTVITAARIESLDNNGCFQMEQEFHLEGTVGHSGLVMGME